MVKMIDLFLRSNMGIGSDNSLPVTGTDWVWIAILVASSVAFAVLSVFLLFAKENKKKSEDTNSSDEPSKKSKKDMIKDIGTYIIMGVSVVTICIAGYMLVSDGIAAAQAGSYSADIVSILDDKIPKHTNGDLEPPTSSATSGYKEGIVMPYHDPSEEQPITIIDGVSFIGRIKIPSVSIDLPVAAEWSYPQLKKSPCRYMGTTYGDSLVILAHNYRSHFAPIKTLEEGAKVLFTDVNGEVSHYEVISSEVLKPTQIEEMVTGDWDLTLFTCTNGGSARAAVRCKKVAVTMSEEE